MLIEVDVVDFLEPWIVSLPRPLLDAWVDLMKGRVFLYYSASSLAP